MRRDREKLIDGDGLIDHTGRDRGKGQEAYDELLKEVKC